MALENLLYVCRIGPSRVVLLYGIASTGHKRMRISLWSICTHLGGDRAYPLLERGTVSQFQFPDLPNCLQPSIGARPYSRVQLICLTGWHRTCLLLRNIAIPAIHTSSGKYPGMAIYSTIESNDLRAIRKSMESKLLSYCLVLRTLFHAASGFDLHIFFCKSLPSL